MINEIMNRAIAAYKDGRKTEAEKLFRQFLKLDPRNETAWLWLSSAVATDEERRACLEKALAINPASTAAKRGLEILSTKSRERVSSPQPKVTPRSQASPTTREPTPDQLEAKTIIEQARGQAALQSNSDAQSNSYWIVGIGIVLLVAAFFGILLLATQKSDEDQNATPTPDPRREIIAVLREHISAHNDEDVDRYMATLHSDAPNYSATRRTLKEMYDMFDLRATLRDVKVIEVKRDTARVSFVLTTKKVRGPAFQDNRVEGEFILKKEKGRWKLFNQKVDNVEYL
jgi:tetratricopeptide (TPR) repeat protein